MKKKTKLKTKKVYRVYCIDLNGESEGFEFKTLKNSLSFIGYVIKKFPYLQITLETRKI